MTTGDDAPRDGTEEIRRAIDEAPVVARPDDRRVIRLAAGTLDAAVDEAEAALLAMSPPRLFQRGGIVTHITERPARRADGSIERQLAFAAAGVDAVLEQISIAARAEKFDARRGDWRVVDMPRRVAETFLARPKWRLPDLRQIAGCPTLRPDGSLLTRAGYDAGTGLYLADDLGGITVPNKPTRRQAVAACDMLTDLLSSFPFVVEPAGEALAVALAGLLGAIARPALSAAPMIGVTAPAAGTGKSYLVDVIATIATGRPAVCVAVGSDSTEFDKALGAAMIEGRPLISLDNVEVTLRGALLNMALSQPSVSVRLLGASRAIEVASGQCWFATGNGLRIADDMTRRVLLCRLDSGLEHPEERSFDADLIEEAGRRRAELVGAALTILRWGASYSLPEGKPLAGFAAWCRRVRDPLLALGHADPVGSLEMVRAGDLDAARLAALLAAWEAAFGENAKTVADVTGLIEAGELRYVELREAVKALSTRGQMTSRQLGNYLAKHENRLAGGLRIERDGVLQRAVMWRVRRAASRG